MTGSTHNHSTGSDGELTPKEVIKKAITLDWDYVYFTDHYFPNPKDEDKAKYFLQFDKDYIQEIKELKEKYKNKIKVYFGVEFGWLEEYGNWIKEQSKKHDFDYIICSIHKLRIDGKNLSIEPEKENWIENLKIIGGVKKYVQEYYKQIRNIAKSKISDSIGHLDYVKIYNQNNEFFSEEEDWYKQEISKTLDVIKQNKIALEINHGGIRKCNSSFPSLWIVKQANKKNIPITLGLDAHDKEHYSNEYLKELINIAKEAGYNEIVRFEKRKMITEKPKIT